ncbi:hypothetical protein BCR34DRAFT_573489 [Clohesyomyces aquaticus]|uniref:Trichothecene 3-O-acetyltransferase-like N-terminal domain-containing protein n=1 Tax=Clohesyomyces aquaticus TaxID=1231657 RepID=A0A1Y1YZK4_9PLEO|nr:hypothetical protein BCR34DRAFT_573489 [Clohesyomyces aquaticus]
MGSTTVHIPLTPLDHAPPKNYSCSLSYLPLKPGVSPLQAFEVLREGLHRTFVQLPWLSGRVWPQSPDSPGYRPGQLEIQHEPVDINGTRPYQLKFNEIEGAETFEELKENAFPTDTFQDESVVWAPFMPDLTDGPEVLVAQANFIPGACVLTAGLFHAASDGVGGVTVFRLWADNCRDLQSGSDAPPVIAPGPEASDRSQVEKLWVKEWKSKSIDEINPLNWTLLGLAPPSSPADSAEQTNLETEADATTETQTEDISNGVPQKDGTSRLMKSAIFYVPPNKFSALQKECAQSGPGLSGTDAITALIWRCSLRARRAAALKVGKPIGDISDPEALAFLAMTVDGRTCFSESLPPNYLGNLTCINLCVIPLALLTADDTSMATIARVIRDGANSITQSNLLDAYALARNVSDFGELSLQNPSLDSTAMLVSPLLTYPTNSLCFGDDIFGNGGKLEALRMPMYSFNRMTRLSLVLPRLAAGGVEFLLNLFEEEMELLLRDPEFKKYAMFLTN